MQRSISFLLNNTIVGHSSQYRLFKFFKKHEAHETLSTREREVLLSVSKGLAYKELAGQLYISIGTVKQHLHRIYEKLHVQNKTEAINKVFGAYK